MGPVAGGAEPVATADLVAAVSEAGGLGVIGGVAYSPDDLRARNQQGALRRRTSPSASDLLLASNFLEKAGSGPTSATVPTRGLVPAETRDALKKMAENLGIEWIEAPPEPPARSWVPEGQSYAGAQIEVLLEEKVPVFASGLGSPAPFARALKDAGTKIVSLVGNARAARRVADGGADIVVAQGTEAGGHTGKIGTLALLPQVMGRGGAAAGRCRRRCRRRPRTGRGHRRRRHRAPGAAPPSWSPTRPTSPRCRSSASSARPPKTRW